MLVDLCLYTLLAWRRGMYVLGWRGRLLRLRSQILRRNNLTHNAERPCDTYREPTRKHRYPNPQISVAKCVAKADACALHVMKPAQAEDQIRSGAREAGGTGGNFTARVAKRTTAALGVGSATTKTTSE